MIGFIPDPIWLIDMLKVHLKQIDRMDGAPKADVELYEWALSADSSIRYHWDLQNPAEKVRF